MIQKAMKKIVLLVLVVSMTSCNTESKKEAIANTTNQAEKEKKDAYEALDVLVNRLESNLVIKKVKEKLFDKYQIHLINKVEFKYKNYGYDVYSLTMVLNGDEDEYTSISLTGIAGKELAKIIKSKDLKPETLF
jgi:ribosome-associated translation inhibitor RaiA